MSFLPLMCQPVVCSSGVFTSTRLEAKARSSPLVRHEHRDLVDELLEVLRLGLLIPQDRQLVLNKRMPDNSQRGNSLTRSIILVPKSGNDTVGDTRLIISSHR